MAPSKERLETYARCKGNSTAKGWAGKRKSVYTGRYKKRRKSCKSLVLVEGEVVVFEGSGGRIFKGVVHGKCPEDNEAYIVRPGTCHGERNDIITHSASPKMLRDIQIDSQSYAVGMTVLVTWQELEGGFVELVPANIDEVHDTFCWVQAGAKSGGCFRVGKDEMCHVTDKSQKLKVDHTEDQPISSHENLNVVRLVLHATQTQLDLLSATYENTKSQLEKALGTSSELASKNAELENIRDDYVDVVASLENQLQNVVKETQADNTLHYLISQQKDMLDSKSKQILALDKEILDLRQDNQQQQREIKELKQQITIMGNDNTTLQSENKTLHKDNMTLNRELHRLEEDKQEFMRTKSTDKPGVILAKEYGHRKSGSFIKMDLPSKGSSAVDKRTLRRRAEKLDEVLKVISSPNPAKPDSVDIITTLAAYLKRHPEIALPACKRANITFMREMTAQEVVDLKVLLKLPMARLQDMRRFLANHNIRFMPSDAHLYRNMRGRESLSPDVVEVGIMSLQKSASSTATESSVAFARVKNIEAYITEHINLQVSQGNTWQHPCFNDEVWIKIGGDKGGTSTKLAMQLVNQKKPNSPDSTNILAMFDAPDTKENVPKVFGIYTEQLADLQMKKTILVDGVAKCLRTFFFGDYEAICKSLGHMGPSATYPCVWCNITLMELRDSKGVAHCSKTKNDHGAWVDNTNWPSKRTVAQYVQDLADLRQRQRVGGRKITGASFHSISGDPILPIATDMDHVIPPSLHILLGLVVRYFKLLELECRRLDHGDLDERDGEQFRQWQRASEIAKLAEVESRETQASLAHEKELMASMLKAKNGRSSKGLCREACDLPLCALTVSKPTSVDRKNVNWIQCTECGNGDEQGWFHAYCVGLTEEEVALGNRELDEFVCPLCKGDISNADDLLNVQEGRVAACETLANDKKKLHETAKTHLDEVYAEVCELRGSIEKELNRVLETELKVKRQAYHSQCFVGNHCKIILDKKDILLDVLPEGIVQTRFRGLFGRLKGIVDLFRADSFLSDEEVSELCTRCYELGHWFPTNFPNESIPPKLHFLICHIPECAIRWRTIGLLSEHGLESIHANINSIERIYCTVRDGPSRMKLVLGNHQQRCTADKSALEVSNENVRRCKNVIQNERCKGRYAIDKTVKNVRVCRVCKHKISF